MITDVAYRSPNSSYYGEIRTRIRYRSEYGAAKAGENTASMKRDQTFFNEDWGDLWVTVQWVIDTPHPVRLVYLPSRCSKKRPLNQMSLELRPKCQL